MSNEEIYQIVYFQDEITINPTTCKQPGFCSCVMVDDGIKCGYTAKEAQKKIADYHEDKARWLRGLSEHAFLHTMGIYIED